MVGGWNEGGDINFFRTTVHGSSTVVVVVTLCEFFIIPTNCWSRTSGSSVRQYIHSTNIGVGRIVAEIK